MRIINGSLTPAHVINAKLLRGCADVNASWMSRKRCSGVLCDRNMPVKFNGDVLKLKGNFCCEEQIRGQNGRTESGSAYGQK